MSKLNIFSSVIFLLFIGCLVIFLASNHGNIFGKSPEPSSVKIKLSEVGVVADFEFEVRNNFSYSFSMSFGYPEHDDVERERVRKLLGGFALDRFGKPLEPGIPTPISLDIFRKCKDGQQILVYSENSDPILTSWGGGNYEKNIGKKFFTSGTYRARLSNKRVAREFESIPIRFEIGMPAKVISPSEKSPMRSALQV